ncbi:hypothetical protein R77592_04304 [Ralstonia mannitolilytica]|uniref:hypothetical protein n=1 Tax=Ralstonia mannitolilytica TaxID=105219 RepID=UPI0028F66F85|nr:hypothetical protein [Ralstonia mannitolilytica]CAJ0737374.1 hypothetical protein R77592_04304 [Ralstonia mannitolilytica]
MTLDDLQQHPLFKEAVQDSIAVHEALGLELAAEFDENTSFDELQFYITGVGFSVTHTLAWVEQLHQAVHFMTDCFHDEYSAASERTSRFGRLACMKQLNLNFGKCSISCSSLCHHSCLRWTPGGCMKRILCHHRYM